MEEHHSGNTPAHSHARTASEDYSSQPPREGLRKSHEPFRLMNVWKKAKLQGKRTTGQVGHKLQAVGEKVDVWLHKHRK